MQSLVLNPYNLGHTTVVAFSLGESAESQSNDNNYEALLEGIVTYLTPVVEYMIPSGIVPVGIAITSFGMSGNLMVNGSAHAPAYIQTAIGLSYSSTPASPIVSTSMTNDIVSWVISMNGITQTSLLYLVRIADAITTYTFTSTTYTSDNTQNNILTGSANVVFSMPVKQSGFGC
ncbi:MAG: hypothetical protein M1491_04730 [Deltaproteobacteria bacterium]|nr:hypothetical protein [Deltaproteobacteria bacterium]